VFAAQSGIKQVAAKGKFEVQAQSDGMDFLAKQGIQIISTEDRIEITSPKEIVITAGGSQIKLDGSGIFPITGGKFEVKAGQHLFMSGAKVQSFLPTLSNLPINKENYKYTNRIDLFDIFKDSKFSKINYRAHLKGQNIYKAGNLDEYGRTERFTSIEAKQEEVIVVVDDSDYLWEVLDEDDYVIENQQLGENNEI